MNEKLIEHFVTIFSDLNWLLIIFKLDNVWVIAFTLAVGSLLTYLLLRYLRPLFVESTLHNKTLMPSFSSLDVGPRAAVVSIKGHRPHMEDTYQAIPQLGQREHWSFYGVFDGHGGNRCSAFAAQFLYRYVWSCLDDYISVYALHSYVKRQQMLQSERNNKSIHDSIKPNTKLKFTTTISNKEKNEKYSSIPLSSTNDINSSNHNSNDNNNNNNNNNNDKGTTILHSTDSIDITQSFSSSSSSTNENLSSYNIDPSFSNHSLSQNTSKPTTMGTDENTQIETSTNKESNLTAEQYKWATSIPKPKKITKRRKNIPTTVQKIMNDALIQAHRDADNEFIEIANREQWADGSTSISCVILPGRDLLQLLSNPKHELVKKGKANPSDRILETISNAMNSHTTSTTTTNHIHNVDDKNHTNSNYHNSQYYHNNNSNHDNDNDYDNSHLNKDSDDINRDSMIISPDMCDDGDTWLFVANTGDSRAVLVREDGSAVAMSFDHKPNKAEERKRIESGGGSVVFFGTWRVQGVLAVARALGDRHLKKWVIPDPEIRCRKVQKKDLLLLLASDGLWDVLSNEDAARLAVETWNNVAYRNFSIKERLQFVASKLTSTAYRTGSMDNITTLAIHLKSHCTSKGEIFKENKNSLNNFNTKE